MNLERLCGNFIVTFCTVMIASSWMDGGKALYVALGASILQGLLAVGLELKGIGVSKGKGKTIPAPLFTSKLFLV